MTLSQGNDLVVFPSLQVFTDTIAQSVSEQVFRYFPTNEV